MNNLKLNLKEQNKKDIEKGQKIIAAVFLSTRHMSDTDPIKDMIRAVATTCVITHGKEQTDAMGALTMLLGGATIAGMLSEKNTSIIINELEHFVQVTSETWTDDRAVSTLFSTVEAPLLVHKKDIQQSFKRTTVQPYSSISETPFKSEKSNSFSDLKNNKFSRQEKILSFINTKKSAVIKDIVALFPEVSEKTLQRELNTLIDTGRITKRGSKRWSIYMAVNSLL